MSMDLISREEAIKAITKYCTLYDLRDLFADIEGLPTALRWIPVEERLPEEDVEVLVCDKDGDMQVADYCYSTELEGAVIWFTRGKCFEEIVAWMPLPEPYKEGEDEADRR